MIELCNISKVYTAKKKNAEVIQAIDHLSLYIEEGSIVGLLGPNGAGKSTLIKMILGVLYPSEGEAIIDGMNSYRNRTRLMQNIGIVFGQRSQLWWDLPAMDTFELIRRMYGVERKQFEKTVGELVEMLGAQQIIYTPVRFLSLGQRMKCEIIAALCFSPKIVILDEPTLGLDIAAKEVIRNFLKQINKERKVTILLATHDLNDVEAICDRVIVINRGKILFDNSSEAIRDMHENKRQLEMIFIPNNKFIEIPFKCDKYEHNGKLSINIAGTSQMITDFMNWCFHNGSIEDVIISKQNIEKIVKELYIP